MPEEISCLSVCPAHCAVEERVWESPYPELFSSTTIPSPAQTSAIEEVVQRAEEELSAKKRAIDHLERQRAELEEFVSTHRGVLSTMRRLPNEMLCDIFSRCEDPVAPFDPLESTLWRVVQVCSRWRAVALACPQLWRHFGSTHRPVRAISLQLQRSDPVPLSIHLH
ncbi:hypothetical protein C8R44DRAFT_684588, partial [Mycena epipterygia]